MDPKTGEEKAATIMVDDGIRPNTNMADLAKLKPAFKKDGTTTAGIYNHKTCEILRTTICSCMKLVLQLATFFFLRKCKPSK